ncbi:MAG: ThiF family adenylyltransferase [Chloroflexaceae bacterium]|jgi:molybdopterin/thiamine biosynthesis adenylyltransferase|nr:ThiF family adenylyltransferase [Chloroflexaceae bacterium]
MTSNIELTHDDFQEDKYDRLRRITWWDQSRLQNANIMIVGAGAIGNELIKNLALLGVGKLLIIDMDTIESSNLTRSVLFRQIDVGRYKADVAAERAMELNPDIIAKPLALNIIEDIGLGVFRRMNLVLGGLDNREARLAINHACYRVNIPWIDGAIEVLNGFARVFTPPHGACYECTMTETDWRLINNRKSCAMLTQEQMNDGKIPTTPTSSAIIAGVQVQEMLKILHSDRGLPTLSGKCYVFNGMTHDSYVVEYQSKPDCMSHDTYAHIEEQLWSVKTMTLRQLVEQIKLLIGDSAIVDFDRDIASVASCSCGAKKDLFTPIHKLNAKAINCPMCGSTMKFDSFHSLNGTEDFLHKTVGEIGIPPLHIVCGRVGVRLRYFEFSADYDEVFSGLDKRG